MSGSAGRRQPLGRLGAVAPVPFVGAATILVALIVFTPVLLSSGPSPLSIQAVLTIDRVVGSPRTAFYVYALGSAVRYAQVTITLGTGFSWTGGCPAASAVPNWTVRNVTDSLELSTATNVTPVVVNATATYARGGTTTYFAAQLAVQVVNRGLPDESISIAACPGIPGQSPPGSWSVANLPLPLLMVNFGSKVPP